MSTENQKINTENPSSQGGAIGIYWDYRCGFSSKNNFERIYKAEVNGVTVWKNAQRHKVSYTIGENKLRYSSENELLRAIEDGKK